MLYQNDGREYLCARFFKTLINMLNTLIIIGVVSLIFVTKCFKELADVRSMDRMTPQEKKAVLERRNFYDNHA